MRSDHLDHSDFPSGVSKDKCHDSKQIMFGTATSLESKDVYEDAVIENYGIPVVITDVLVRKHKITGINIYTNHLDSIRTKEN